jgi:hypothetical protein
MESDLARASTLTLTGSAAEVVDQINARSILAAGSVGHLGAPERHLGRASVLSSVPQWTRDRISRLCRTVALPTRLGVQAAP